MMRSTCICVVWLVLLSATWGSSAPAISTVDNRALCGYSKITRIKCWMQDSSTVLPFIVRMEFETEDGQRTQYCPIPSNDNRKVVTIDLEPGDSIYNIKVCYDPRADRRIVGFMFGGVAKQYFCGNPWMRPDRCSVSSTLVPAPLSYFGGTCNEVFTRLDTVCWNKWYRPRESQQACLAGEGVAVGGSWCQPCGDGTYNPGGLGKCMSCPAGQVTPGACCSTLFVPTAGAAICSCPPGQGFHPTLQRCRNCNPGYYSPGGALSPCIACPLPFMTTARGAASIEECVCMAGYGYNSTTGLCAICQRGKYGTGMKDPSLVVAGQANLAPCKSCPAGKTTLKPEATKESFCSVSTTTRNG